MFERNVRLAPHVSKTAKTCHPKLFALDTNVLMHDPTSIFRFGEPDLYLPIFTLEWLDNKKDITDVARNARQASRYLDELVTAAVAISGDISTGARIPSHRSKKSNRSMKFAGHAEEVLTALCDAGHRRAPSP
jgi:PhoH-like ATPase